MYQYKILIMFGCLGGSVFFNVFRSTKKNTEPHEKYQTAGVKIFLLIRGICLLLVLLIFFSSDFFLSFGFFVF